MKTKNLSTANLFMSIAELVIGVLLLINPIGFTSWIIIAMGAALAVMGLVHVVNYFRTAPERAAQTDALAKGLLFIVCGLFCAFRSGWFVVTFPVITVLYGVLILVTGVSKLQTAIDMARLKRKYWFVALIGAIITLIFATLIITNPFASIAILWTFIGVSLVIEAVIDVITYIFSKKS